MRNFAIKTEEQGQLKFHLLKGPQEAIVNRKTGVRVKQLDTSEPISQKKNVANSILLIMSAIKFPSINH